MRRRTFDIILTAVGGVLTVGLLVAGLLLVWGYSFANGNVHDQLAAQKIFFPAKGSEALAPAEIGKYLNKYAGQQLTSGAQAEAYADHFIAVHLKSIGAGKTYSQMSAEAQANPNDAALQGKVQTLFRGETLRGMLLNAYAFWKLGQIALYSAIIAFIGTAIMLALTALGFMHLRRVPPEQEMLTGHRKADVPA
jgi:hypothetical protein